MKLIYCPDCKDVVSLREDPIFRVCECNASWGRYDDEEVATIGGKAIPFGIDNVTFHHAMLGRLIYFHGLFYEPLGWFSNENIKKDGET